MLPLKNRLTASSDIKRVVVSGARVRTTTMAIYSTPSSYGGVRFACVAGKKVHSSSVVRHAVQRKIRAACSEVVTSLEGSYDIVIVALTPTIRSLGVKDMARDILQGVRKTL